jgi:hypothetical protein
MQAAIAVFNGRVEIAFQNTEREMAIFDPRLKPDVRFLQKQLLRYCDVSMSARRQPTSPIHVTYGNV